MILRNNRVLRKELCPAPRKDRPNRNETKYLTECISCGKTRWLAKVDVEKDSKCRACSGLDKVRTQDGIRSGAEDKVARWLRLFGISFCRQWPDYKRAYLFDFKLNTDFPPVFLEVVGYWHRITKSEKDKNLENKHNVIFIDDDVSIGELAWRIGQKVDGVSPSDLLEIVMF